MFVERMRECHHFLLDLLEGERGAGDGDPLDWEAEVCRGGVSGPAFHPMAHPLWLLPVSFFCLPNLSLWYQLWPCAQHCGALQELDTLTTPSLCRRMDLE